MKSMKNSRLLLAYLFTAALVIFISIPSYATRPPSTIYMSMSEFQPQPGDTDDRARIQRAIDSIYSGTIIFDEAGIYWVSDTINLKEYITLQGGGLNTLTGTPTSSSHIRLTQSGRPLFKMDDPFSAAMALRDIGLSATSSTGTIGLLAEGGTGQAINNVEFSNVQFSGFHYGIRAAALSSSSDWQFDNVKMDHCLFVVPETNAEEQDMEDRHAGIYVDSSNSGWSIGSTSLVVSKNSLGLFFKRIAYTTIDSLIANGPIQQSQTNPQLQNTAYASIYVKSHGSLRISNSVSEGVYYDILVDPDYPITFPINLISNSFQGQVNISGSDIVSIGNQFGLIQPWTGNPDGSNIYRSPLPVAGDNSQVYSMGDRFCTEQVLALPTLCNDTWQTDGGVRHVSFGMYESVFEAPMIMKNFAKINFPTDFTNSGTIGRPMLSIMSPFPTTRPLLRLGNQYTDAGTTTDYHYTLSRNSTDGFLEFEGSQAVPNTGYRFNGPVSLPKFTYLTLPTPQADGSLVFCSNCFANNLTCSSGGNGALAMSLSSAWICK